MKWLFFILIVIIPNFICAQNNKFTQNKVRLYLGLSYLIHDIDNYIYEDGDLTIKKSKHIGLEFGFSLLPQNENGIYVDFKNNLLGELAAGEICKLFGFESTGDLSVDKTISSGFFGRVDIGKIIYTNGLQYLKSGFVISDKYISGDFISEYDPSDPTRIIIPSTRPGEVEGFHITPGVYAEFSRFLGQNNILSLNLCLTQSIFNLWDINSDLVYLKPLFPELNIKFLNQSGVFVSIGSILMIPYRDIYPSCRLSFTLGYNLFLAKKTT